MITVNGVALPSVWSRDPSGPTPTRPPAGRPPGPPRPPAPAPPRPDPVVRPAKSRLVVCQRYPFPHLGDVVIRGHEPVRVWRVT